MDSAGYSVAVVATEDGTTAESNGELATLDQGETALFEYPLINGSIAVNCSRNCLVTQYSKFMLSGSYRFGFFMHNVLSENDFTALSTFTTLYAYPTSYVSLVLMGESPGNNLFLNGTSLGFLDWSPLNGYSTAAVSIPSGVYELDSTDGRPFAAYVYYHENYNAGGAGYALLPEESSRVTPSSTTLTTTSTNPTSATTPAPSVNSTLPQHTARVNGTASTEDGEDMSPTCIMVSIFVNEIV